MVRKPKRQAPAKAEAPRTGSNRDKAIAALMELLAEQSFEDIGLAEVAGRAGIKLSELRSEFGSTLAILGAHIKQIDAAVLDGGDADMAEETPRGPDAPMPAASSIQLCERTAIALSASASPGLRRAERMIERMESL